MNPLRHWKTILGLLVVFAAGVVVGGVLVMGKIRRDVQERSNPDTWTTRTMAWFHGELHITPEQENHLRPVVEKSMGEMRELRNDAEARWREIVGELLTNAAPLLDDRQREHLRQLIDRAAADPHRWPAGHVGAGRAQSP